MEASWDFPTVNMGLEIKLQVNSEALCSQL